MKKRLLQAVVITVDVNTDISYLKSFKLLAIRLELVVMLVQIIQGADMLRKTKNQSLYFNISLREGFQKN